MKELIETVQAAIKSKYDMIEYYTNEIKRAQEQIAKNKQEAETLENQLASLSKETA